ncbi:YunC family protein [Sporosarcina sp. NCCP-2716]|uniref:YunC family protein n=1 Tax=Sporosarcina sp. NCCP-2716 TaxID=2943679 RepID=UPI0037D9E00F
MYRRKGEDAVVTVNTVSIEGHSFTAVSVSLPKTTLLTVSNDHGYIMCGALDVGLLNRLLGDRKIIAGRATGVKTIEELLAAPLESVTLEAESLGITAGMTGEQALLKMC